MKNSKNTAHQQLMLKLALLGVLAANVSWNHFHNLNAGQQADLASAGEVSGGSSSAAAPAAPVAAQPTQDFSADLKVASAKADSATAAVSPTTRKFEMQLCGKTFDYTYSLVAPDDSGTSKGLKLQIVPRDLNQSVLESSIATSTNSLDFLDTQPARKLQLESSIKDTLIGYHDKNLVDCTGKDSTPVVTELNADSGNTLADSIGTLTQIARSAAPAQAAPAAGNSEVAGSTKQDPKADDSDDDTKQVDPDQLKKDIAECRVNKRADKDGSHSPLSTDEAFDCNMLRLGTLDIDDTGTSGDAQKSLKAIKDIVDSLMPAVRSGLKSKDADDVDTAKDRLDQIQSALQDIFDNTERNTATQTALAKVDKMIDTCKALSNASDVYSKSQDLLARSQDVNTNYRAALADMQQDPTSPVAFNELQSALGSYQQLYADSMTLDYTTARDPYGRIVKVPGPYEILQSQMNHGALSSSDFQDFTRPYRALDSSLQDFTKVSVTRDPSTGKIVINDSSLNTLPTDAQLALPADLAQVRSAMPTVRSGGQTLPGFPTGLTLDSFNLGGSQYGNYGTSVIQPSGLFTGLTSAPTMASSGSLTGGSASVSPVLNRSAVVVVP